MVKRKELEVILDKQASRLEELEERIRNQDNLVRTLARLTEQVREGSIRTLLVLTDLFLRSALASICVGRGTWRVLLNFLMTTLNPLIGWCSYVF